MTRVRRLLATLAIGISVGGALAGCVGSTPAPTATPSASATPLYATDAEALAAAKASYANYLRVANAVSQSGWSDTSPLPQVTTGRALEADQKSAAQNHSEGLKLVGDITGEITGLQKTSPGSILAYACVDFSGTRIVDSAGKDATSPNRTTVIPWVITFTKPSKVLLVERIATWSGDTFC